MINTIMEDTNYQNLVISQLKNTIEYLLSCKYEFSITANIESTLFTPSLPQTIHDQLSPFTLFVLSNYTYSTVQLDEETLSFEAGFGRENFGSLVTVPYHAIFQIIVGESILFINTLATLDKKEIGLREKRSFNAFKNNPHNKKFMK